MGKQNLWNDMLEKAPAPFELWITLDYAQSRIEFEWIRTATNAPEARLTVCCTDLNELTWELSPAAGPPFRTGCDQAAIRSRLNYFRRLFPVDARAINTGLVACDRSRKRRPAGPWQPILLPWRQSRWKWVEENILRMAEELRIQFSPLPHLRPGMEEEVARPLRRLVRRADREEREARARAARIRAATKRQEEQKRQREAARRANKEAQATGESQAPVERPPVPPVPLNIELPSLQFQDTLIPLPDLRRYFLAEQACRWWISNQSDDLLAWPYCRLERLEYQLRTALRVIGPLRGRALLSDEVGLGKTIEAGLIVKEYLTRGMIQRCLVLTVPSLVDQWEEEMQEKFQIDFATTNQPVFRADPGGFWRENRFLIASLHTLKQPAHLSVAQQVNWDMLVVDEAHYLRNRTSQAWQAVNALPRQYLLLLTATPVQNSLEDLYNLVTLLQPGQLPSPKEFRQRFMDKKRPRQPREPEALRRVLSQIMIRNTRASAGITLPPRRAETILFEPGEAELDFWQRWETEFRKQLDSLSSSQASHWGRLLLQGAGSSPHAWREALQSFPVSGWAQAWAEGAPLEGCWIEKCDLLVPMSRGEGGLVVFTQFLATQAALAKHLQKAQVPVWVINGQTPAAQRQPITEEFRSQGGALLLTRSGTEGRNLQFCHQIVNFDLPWNPMELEQRIGRLHRIGQHHPVRISNLVQKHTLQDHLLQILQEKLNLFELVVGETGLILGERFSSEEFAEEIFHRWRDSEGRVAESLRALGEDLAVAHNHYAEVKKLDGTLFAQDYETL